jgi:CRISPR-associated protein Cas1
METLFVSRDVMLKRRENTLSIHVNNTCKSFPIESIRHIVLLAESQLNSKLLCLCGKHATRISIFDYYGYFKGAFEPINANPSGKVKLAQAKVLMDDQRRMPLAREIVHAAGHNMRANLQYYLYRGNTALESYVAQMNTLMSRITHCNDTATLMGIEGNLHQWYYTAWAHIDPALEFGKRIRRPPNNPVNCLISFLNQLVYTVVRHETFKTHLEETFSLLHSPGTGRASLSLDLSEPFKPLLADMLIFRFYRKSMVRHTWFDQQDGVCLLSELGRKHVAEHFALRLEEKYQGKTFREWIYREALNIERHIMDVAEYNAFKRRV